MVQFDGWVGGMAAKAFCDRTIAAGRGGRSDDRRYVVANNHAASGSSLMGRASSRYPRHSRIHPIHLRLGGAVGWNIHHRIIDDMEAVDAGYGNSTEAAREHDIVCNGNVLPKPIED